MKYCLCWLLCFLSLPLFAQQGKITGILAQPEIREEKYQVEESGSKVLFLPMQFGKAELTVKQRVYLTRLAKAQIAGIDLVYSDYPPQKNFSALNRKRLQNLSRVLPAAFTGDDILFRKIRQTGGADKTSAAKLVHGFYIYFRPAPGKAAALEEVMRIKALLRTGKEKISTDTSLKYCMQWSIQTDSLFLPDTPKNFSRTIIKMLRKQALEEELMTKEEYRDFRGYDSVYCILDISNDGCDNGVGDVSFFESEDSTVSAVFRRHNWKKATVLADVTGSMYPYTGQLLQWLKLTMTDSASRQFVFFNDGDDKEDLLKVIGSTGGIYKITTAKYDEVESTIINAMLHGSGGDAPENNIEALLSVADDKLLSDTIVMIADNWAPVKDITLLDKVTRPVKIVLCGVYGPIHPDYLNIARKTKGSLHLIEQDIYELSKMKEGDTIEIKGIEYRLTDGVFHEVIKKSI